MFNFVPSPSKPSELDFQTLFKYSSSNIAIKLNILIVYLKMGITFFPRTNQIEKKLNHNNSIDLDFRFHYVRYQAYNGSHLQHLGASNEIN